MILKTIKIPIYRCRLHVGVGDDFLEMAERFKIELHEDDIDTINDVAGGFSTRTICGSRFVIMLKEDSTAGEISHECLHVVNRVLLTRGVLADYENDEAQAYLLTWIVDAVYNILNKCKN